MNTQINSFSNLTYGQLSIGLIIVAVIVGYIAYNVVKFERKPIYK